MNNYRLTIDGLDCTRVSRIEPLTAKTGLVQNQRTTAHTDVSSLVVTLPAASAESFLDWHDDFVVAGHNDPSHEKSGTLQIMSADLRPVFTISLVGCGIYKAETLPTASSEDIPKVQASLYCNDMSFTAN